MKNQLYVIFAILSLLGSTFPLPQSTTNTQPLTQQQVALTTQAAYDPKPLSNQATSALQAAQFPETATAYAQSIEGNQTPQTGMPTTSQELVKKPLPPTEEQAQSLQPKESDDINAAKAKEYYP